MILKISVSDLCFFYESLWSKFYFFALAVIFSKFLDGIKEKAHKHHKKVANFHKFEHLWVQLGFLNTLLSYKWTNIQTVHIHFLN